MAIASTNKKGSSKRIKASKIGSSTRFVDLSSLMDINLIIGTSRCVLASLLVSPSNNALDAMAYLYSLAPAKVDQEFRLLCLHDSDADGLHLLKTLLQAAFKCQHVSLNFDVIQSYVHRILTLHGSKFIASFAMRPAIVGAKEFTESAVEQLQLLLHTALCILKTSLQIQIV